MAIVVTFFPDQAALRLLIKVLLKQVDIVTVVDNTPNDNLSTRALMDEQSDHEQRLRLIRLGQNQGIAAALNRGIASAMAEKMGYVLLSDQDSLPDVNMVATLLQVLRQRKEEGVRVGCVNPEYFDLTTAQAFPFQIKKKGRFFYAAASGDEAAPSIEILTGITSGSLIPLDVIRDVGGMREDFFIEYVDAEWCHRVRHKGYSLYGTSMARLNHRLGDECFQVWFLGWRPYSGYSPLRLYYRFRNFVLLMKLSHVEWRWKVRACCYCLGNVYAYLLFSPHRLKNLRMVLRGLIDGVLGRAGVMK